MNREEILVIDCSESIRKLIQDQLQKNNYNVLLAETGTEGLRMYEKHRPDLVLVDTHLPDHSGFTIGRQIRRRSNTPVIFLSPYHESATIVKAFEEGADDFVCKPFDSEVLAARVGAVLRRTALAGQRQKPKPVRSMAPSLTEKEHNLLVLIEQGKSNREIANIMQLTEGTVKVYNSILYGKLRAKNRVQAIIQAKKWGILR